MPPKLTFATLCDSAAEYSGKLCLMGAFDTLQAPQFPMVHLQCSLAVRMLFRTEDVATVHVKLRNSKGEDIMPNFSRTLEVGLTTPDGAIPFQTANFILNLQRLKFDSPGEYTLSISTTDNPEDGMALPINVKLIKAGAS